MLDETLSFMKEEGIRTTSAIGTLLDSLDENEETDLLKGIEQVMADYGLLDSQRISSLILTLADEQVSNDEEGENGEIIEEE